MLPLLLLPLLLAAAADVPTDQLGVLRDLYAAVCGPQCQTSCWTSTALPVCGNPGWPVSCDVAGNVVQMYARSLVQLTGSARGISLRVYDGGGAR